MTPYDYHRPQLLSEARTEGGMPRLLGGVLRKGPQVPVRTVSLPSQPRHA